MKRLLVLFSFLSVHVGVTSGVDLASPSVFDARFYINNHYDLSHIGIDTESEAWSHWLTKGIDEGRQGCGKFHSKQYLERYDDLKQAFHSNYRQAIQHYIQSGIKQHRLGYMDGGYDGRWTISNGADLFISSSDRMGGAIDSLVWNDKEMINMHDHGRELQMACNSNSYVECYNPTEAGGRDDGRLDSTNSHINWVHAHGNTLSSEVLPAFWLRPGTHETQNTHSRCNAGSPALNHEKTYAYPFSKTVTIGTNGVSNAIKFVSNFTLAGDWPSDLNYIQMEAPTGYMPGEFSKQYSYNRATGTMETTHNNHKPVVLATADGQYAMGAYAPAGQDTDIPVVHGSTTFGIHSFTSATAKWNLVFRKKRFQSGIHHQVYTAYICVGTLDMVSTCLHTMTGLFPHV